MKASPAVWDRDGFIGGYTESGTEFNLRLSAALALLEIDVGMLAVANRRYLVQSLSRPESMDISSLPSLEVRST